MNHTTNNRLTAGERIFIASNRNPELDLLFRSACSGWYIRQKNGKNSGLPDSGDCCSGSLFFFLRNKTASRGKACRRILRQSANDSNNIGISRRIRRRRYQTDGSGWFVSWTGADNRGIWNCGNHGRGICCPTAAVRKSERKQPAPIWTIFMPWDCSSGFIASVQLTGKRGKL